MNAYICGHVAQITVQVKADRRDEFAEQIALHHDSWEVTPLPIWKSAIFVAANVYKNCEHPLKQIEKLHRQLYGS